MSGRTRSRTRTSLDGTASFTYYDANKLSRVGTVDQASDGDGNQTGLTWPGGCLYQYDSLNRLTYQGGGPESLYAYDGLGRRVKSNSTVPTEGTRYYVFDGDLLIGEVVADGAAYYPAVAYTWGADGLVSERFLPSGPSRWYHQGPQGETRYLTDAASPPAVTDSYRYTAYCVPVASTGGDRNPFRYGGQFGYYTDPGGYSGIILCAARWYNPHTARWMTRDPIGYAGGENLYGYCEQNPTAGLDSWGLDTSVFNGCRLKRYAAAGPSRGKLMGSWPAYSGVPGARYGGAGQQEIPDYMRAHYGPIPPGTYYFREDEVRPTLALQNIGNPDISSSRLPIPWGRFFVRLNPDAATADRIRAYGRVADFNLHGGGAT